MLDDALHTFLFAFHITAPIFVMLFLGLWLKTRNVINDGFIKTASQLVYSLGLPVMLFITCATTNTSHATDWRLLAAFGLMCVGWYRLSANRRRTRAVFFGLRALLLGHMAGARILWVPQASNDDGVAAAEQARTGTDP